MLTSSRSSSGRSSHTSVQDRDVESGGEENPGFIGGDDHSSDHSRCVSGDGGSKRKGCGDFHLAVIGKSGTGKSSLCNQIFGDETMNRFFVDSGLKSITVKSQTVLVDRCEQTFTLTDTPCEQMDIKRIIGEIKRHCQLFHCKLAFLQVVRSDTRYAEEEDSIYLEHKRGWNDDADFCRRLVVVFTHGDSLEDEDLKEKLKVTWPQLQGLLKDAGDRYVRFNNKLGHRDESAVSELLAVVRKMDLLPQEGRQQEVRQQCTIWGVLLGCFFFTAVIFTIYLILVTANILPPFLTQRE